MVPLSFAGRAFFAHGDGALFWPERRTWIVADLHLEKASCYAGWGQMLPPYDSRATLESLAAMIAGTDTRALWCLGDSFHDPDGAARMAIDARALLTDMTGRLHWTWITGNHDSGPFDPHGGAVAEEAVVDGIVLRHQARKGETRPELSGHFHPRIRIAAPDRALSRPIARRCFVVAGNRMILPAFGALTGGMDAAHPEILRALATGDNAPGVAAEAWVPVADRLLRFPLNAAPDRRFSASG